MKEAEADDEADAEVQPEGTIEIGVDVAIRIDIPDDLVVPDAIERLGQLEEGMQCVYYHLLVIPLKRIDDIESRLIVKEGRQLIADRYGLLEHVVTLEGSNTRLYWCYDSEGWQFIAKFGLCRGGAQTDVIRMANGLMDQIVRVYAARNVEQKRKFENNPWGNHVQQPPFKRQNVVQAVTVANNKKR
nr:hypothetical protein [Tanacetum cinerariifolium]